MSITELARNSGRPDRFIGLHWFNPPALMKLVEVPKGMETSQETVKTVVDLARRLGKEPVDCKNSPGFVVNRILNVWYNEGMRLLDEGVASVSEIDGAIRDGGGFRMGPMQLRDMVGLDTALLISESLQSWETISSDLASAYEIGLQQAISVERPEWGFMNTLMTKKMKEEIKWKMCLSSTVSGPRSAHMAAA
jgi:3-hydroxyacyl-CoA dehydrogenase